MTLTCYYRGAPLWTWEATTWPPAEVFTDRWGPDWSYTIIEPLESAEHQRPLWGRTPRR